MMFIYRTVTAGMLALCVACAAGQVNSLQTGSKPVKKAGHSDTPDSDIRISGAQIKMGMNATKLEANMDQMIKDAIADGQTPGAVVLVLRDGEIVMNKAYGNRAVAPTTETATIDTIYDMASLTKPIATATSIMKLVEDGKIRLTDSIDKYIPEWKNTPEEKSTKELIDRLEKAIGNGDVGLSNNVLDFSKADALLNDLKSDSNAKLQWQSASILEKSFNLLPRDRESITIRHLLTHTSGLPSFVRYYEKFPEKGARKKIVSDIAQIGLRGPVGGQFIYSDLGFIVLGDIVDRVSGMPLDEYSHKEIFEPLGMVDTGFNPTAEKIARVAPTEWRTEKDPATGENKKTVIRGQVHDGNAWVQDGISGHAGLFSTTSDLSRFFTMMINGGHLDGVQILSPITIATMTTDHARMPDSAPQRGLGWDLTSGYNGQKGNLFLDGYGHTGFTGTSAWVVPEEKLAIVILANRVHPDGKGDTIPLRAKAANIVAGSIVESYAHQPQEKK